MDISKIVQNQLPESQYINESVDKNQIYLHHTAGNKSATACINGWARNSIRVATAFVIGYDGTIAQAFFSGKWAWHLGAKDTIFKGQGLPYKILDKYSIGIELTNWAFLDQRDGKYFNYVNGEVPGDEITVLDEPFKRHKIWHKYTDEQIASLKELLIYLGDKYDIDLTYHDDIWDVCPRALKGENGVFTHNSIRKDKSDVYPCPRLVDMLKSL